MLSEIHANPNNPDLRDKWIEVAQDLTRAVFTLQFGSLRGTADQEDLEQSALLEFHRVVLRLAAMTPRCEPDLLFRILYSVAKFSMFRELAKLRKGSVPPDYAHPLTAEPDVENLEGHDGHEGEARETHVTTAWDADAEIARKKIDVVNLVNVSLPNQLAASIDRLNLYREDTVAGSAVRFVALQALFGRYVSASFVRSCWRVKNPQALVTYARHVARASVVEVGPKLARAL